MSYADNGAGRLASLSSVATSYAPAASVSNIGYAPHNGLSTETYGSGATHTRTYNNRLQPIDIKLTRPSGRGFTILMDLAYDYGTTNNNGNLNSTSYYYSASLSYTQTFSYDALNRLTTASETSGATTNWTETNAYDRYGNRWLDLGGGSQNLTFSTSNNRITTSGFSYDSAGNLTNDGVHSYAFDAQSKIVKLDSVTAYSYDGEGQRVKKLVGENTRFVYGITGELIAEFDGSSGNLKKEYVNAGVSLITIEPAAVNANGTQYATSDHLGTPRVVTNLASFEVISRHDYKPFGEEIPAGVGGRTTTVGYSNGGDTNRKKFTSKERDTETGLDYFGARYYSSTQGRFVSIDPAGGDPLKPQSFNKYQYGQNNPLCKVDSNGTYEEDVHKDLTTILAYAAGFTWNEAVQIGNETQKVDEDERNPVQFDLDGPGYRARRDFHFTTPAQRNELWHTFEVDAFGSNPDLMEYRWSNRAQAFYDLGTYLHALQDSYSHAAFGSRLGHIFQGHAPDKTFNDVLKANIMARDTYDALGRALTEFRFAAVTRVSWTRIRPFVDRFNKAKTAKDKKKILDELRGVIESERLERTLKGGFGCIYGEGYSGLYH